MTRVVPFLLVAFWLAISPVVLSSATIVRKAAPLAVVALPSEPDEFEKRAAEDLTHYVQRMSGAQLPTVTVDAADVKAFLVKSKAAGQVPILLGRNVRERLKDVRAADAVRGSFALQVDDGAI